MMLKTLHTRLSRLELNYLGELYSKNAVESSRWI